MRTFFSAAAVACVALCVSTASAQVVHIQFGSGGPYNDGTYAVGPYSGTENGTPVSLDCLDFFHQVTSGELWDANVTGLTSGNLADTRYGNAGIDNYEKQAYLTTFYAAAAGNQAEHHGPTQEAARGQGFVSRSHAGGVPGVLVDQR